jgi:hypothetical protein
MVSTSPDKRVRRRKRSLQNPKLPFSEQIENIGKPQKTGYFGKCLAEREGFAAATRNEAKPLILSIDPKFSQLYWARFAAV